MLVKLHLGHYVEIIVSEEDETRCSKECEYYDAPSPTVRQCTVLNRTIPLTRDLDKPDNPFRSDLCMNQLYELHREVLNEAIFTDTNGMSTEPATDSGRDDRDTPKSY